MIIFDTETTGLLQVGRPLEQQPRIIELGLLKLDAELNVIDTFHQLCNPGAPLPPEITKITGLKDQDLQDAPSFARVTQQLANFCLGERVWLAHNVEFDKCMLVNELLRVDWQYRFPYPIVWMDSIQFASGKSLNNWSKELLGDQWEAQSHRAIGDCERLLACYKIYIRELRPEANSSDRSL